MKKIIIFLIAVLIIWLSMCEAGEATDNYLNGRKYRVKKITTIKEPFVKSMDWHHDTNMIVFGKMELKDKYFDVFVMKPDGSGEKCLTCNKNGIPQKHNGNPAWHPSGDYIVFTAEISKAPRKMDKYAIPGSGLGCNLWLMDRRGRKYFPLTNYSLRPPIKGVIHPQFSHDGKKLFWAERVSKGNSFSGGWIMKIADFVDNSTKPHLANIKTISPGRKKSCFYESHAFSKDDKKILFSGDLIPGQTPYGLDIYEFDLESKRLTRLTKTNNDWDEHAHYSPDGTKIAWMSSTGFNIDWDTVPAGKHFDYLSTELWIMDADGTSPQRLTYFNKFGHPHYIGPKTIVSDSAWSPDGKKIVALIAYRTRKGMNSKIVMIELE